MFNIGTQELIIILVLALIIFGPKKLPEIGRSLGAGLRELKRASNGFMDSIENDGENEKVKESEKDVSNRSGDS